MDWREEIIARNARFRGLHQHANPDKHLDDVQAERDNPHHGMSVSFGRRLLLYLAGTAVYSGDKRDERKPREKMERIFQRALIEYGG
jgi:hypothetical protein